ncbi:unnamed protein product [Mytilus coruscus]|uniref:Integrase zinc-binding domain-containing protein n=1 Tax=Mytilus coruscus TaxID=42192 RepID=A0A6J8CWL5_MYTCO|nr:unnamed protein product [Mytilus coruscus]
MGEGLLFDSLIAKCKGTKLFDSYQLALPEVDIKTIIRLYHDSPLGGHGGIQHTADMLKEHYYFPKFLQIVTDYVRGCTSPAYVRKPNHNNYFMDPVITNMEQIMSEHESIPNDHIENSENDNPCNYLVLSGNELSNINDTLEHDVLLRRSKRTSQKPVRFRNNDFTTPESSVDSQMSETVKIKCLLACKIVNGAHKYLVHLSGEPAQNVR